MSSHDLMCEFTLIHLYPQVDGRLEVVGHPGSTKSLVYP